MNNKENKTLNHDLVKMKFKNKKELVESKQNLRKNISNLKTQILKAKQNEIELKIKIKKEIIKDKQDVKKNELNKESQWKAKNDLINQNKIHFKEQLLAHKKELKLIKIQQKQELMKNKKIQKDEFLRVKSQIRLEKQQQKQLMIETKIINKQKIINANNRHWQEKNQISKIKIEQKKLIAKKKQELLKEQARLNIQKKDNISKKIFDRIIRLEKAKLIKQELKKQVIQEKNKYKNKIIEIKNQQFMDKNKLQKSKNEHEIKINDMKNGLIKEKAKANKEIVQEIQNINSQNFQELKIHNKKYVEEKEGTPKLFNEVNKYKIDNLDFNWNAKEYALIKGSAIKQIGKFGLKKIKQINKNESKLNIDKIPFSKTIIDNIKEFQKCKKEGNLVDVREFIKYVSFLTQHEIKKQKIEIMIFSTIYDILQGKTFAFLGGYFYLKKLKKIKTIEFSKKLINPTQHFVISLQKEDFAKQLEKRMLKTLNNEGFIQILNNIAIKKVEDKIMVVVDLPFMR